MSEQPNAIEIATPQELAPCATFEELGALVSSYSKGVGDGTRQALRGSLAIGAAILIFSERPDVRVEVEKLNHTGRHRPFTPAGYVARQLAKHFGAALPCYEHLRTCTRAAKVAQERKINGGSLRKLLGWDLEAVNAFVGDGGLKLPRLPAPKEKAEPRVEDRAKRIVRQAKRIADCAVRIAALAHAQTPAFRWTDFPDAKQKFDALIERANDALQHLQLCIVDRGRKRRR